MMYSFGARQDFTVMDEPFYAAYLKKSGAVHPMHEQIMNAHETDPEKVALSCTQGGAPHLYMKHMPHHMLDGFPIEWARQCVNIHLVRHPARVIASYAAKRDAPTLQDIGFRQQLDIYNRVGGLVVDSTDIRADPKGVLTRLCDAIDLPFDPAMLHWPAGPRTEDGVWAAHWYGAVHRSKGFAGAEGDLPAISGPNADLMAQALPYYEELFDKKMR